MTQVRDVTVNFIQGEVEHTQAIIMDGMKILGRSRLSKILVNGSKTEYETKKMVRVALY
jgi:hypothetical protein